MLITSPISRRHFAGNSTAGRGLWSRLFLYSDLLPPLASSPPSLTAAALFATPFTLPDLLSVRLSSPICCNNLLRSLSILQIYSAADHLPLCSDATVHASSPSSSPVATRETVDRSLPICSPYVRQSSSPQYDAAAALPSPIFSYDQPQLYPSQICYSLNHANDAATARAPIVPSHTRLIAPPSPF